MTGERSEHASEIDLPGASAELGDSRWSRPNVFGHGVSYMEREIRWHYLPMDDAQYATALSELGALESRRAAA